MLSTKYRSQIRLKYNPEKTQYAAHYSKSGLPNERFSLRICRWLLVITPLISILWYPLFTVPLGDSSNVVPMDLLLMMGWLLSLFLFSTRSSAMSKTEKLAWQIALWANVPLILSPLAALATENSSSIIIGILIHLKRIGLASILVPLAVQCRLYKAQWPLLLIIGISVIALWLSEPSVLGLDNKYVTQFQLSTGRSVSLLYNPNTLGFVAGMYGLLWVVYIGRDTSKQLNLALAVGIIVTLLLLQSAASRTATITLIPCVLYLLIKRNSFLIWALFFLFLAMSILIAVNATSLHQNLIVSRFLELEQSDQNLSARLDIQLRALSHILSWPLGAGIGNIGQVVFGVNVRVPTTDSLYVDYLAAMGFCGLGSIFWLLVIMWRGLTSPSRGAIAGRVIIIYVALFSLAGVGLASNFVSPLFFLIIGLGLSLNEYDSLSDEEARILTKQFDKRHHPILAS